MTHSFPARRSSYRRRAVLGLLFEDGLLAQQVAGLALDIVAKGLVHRLGLQLQVGGPAQQAEQALAQVDQAQARGLQRFLDQGDALAVGAAQVVLGGVGLHHRSEEHTSEPQSLMRISYAVFCLTKKNNNTHDTTTSYTRH